MKIKQLCCVYMLAIVFIPFTVKAQYQKVDGIKILDENGNEILWRGIGLGGWMLQEGYMLGTSGPQHELEARIDELIGSEKRANFYEAWWSNHMRKIDVDSMAAWGFNMIRLPMHYKLFTPPIEDEPVQGEITWLDKGFVMTDSLVSWCKSNDIYLILDLHAAPGGQGENADISDYDATKPSLWESDLNKKKTIALWRKLAERYVNEPTIVAYDLINETNWGFQDHASDPNGCAETLSTPLWDLQKEITEAIREVDPHHIIVIEGNCWGNNYAGLPELWDDNLVISYHKYWNDENDVNAALNMRAARSVPVWLGETGENSNTWFTNTVATLEQNDIGWSWWPLKKVGLNNPLEIPRNDSFQAILDYWDDPSNNPKPTEQVAYDGLMMLAKSTQLEHNIFHKDVPDALIRQPFSTETLPFITRSFTNDELVIQATDFDLGRNNYAYYDTDTANYHGSTGTYTSWNAGWSYRNDGVDIQPSEDTSAHSNGYNVGWTKPGEWMQYTLKLEKSGSYDVAIRHASPSNAQIQFEIEGAIASDSINLPLTDGFQNWETTTVKNLALNKGVQTIRIFTLSEVNLGYFKLKRSSDINDVQFQGKAANTHFSGYAVVLDLNQRVDSLSLLEAEGFELVIDGQPIPAIPTKAGPRKIMLTIDQPINDSQEILLNYAGNKVISEEGVPLEAIAAMGVFNNLPRHHQIPGTVEAEDFFTNEGLVLETTSDEGAGFNLGYTNVGDFLEYRINVVDTGLYQINSRIACLNNAGEFLVQQIDEEGVVLNEAEVEVPVTGGWQTWETVTNSEIYLNKGRSILKITITDTEFNLNWISFSVKIVNGINERMDLVLYPNPTNESISLSVDPEYFNPINQLAITNISGQHVYQTSNLTFQDLQMLDINSLKKGMYMVSLTMSEREWLGKLIVD